MHVQEDEEEEESDISDALRDISIPSGQELVEWDEEDSGPRPLTQQQLIAAARVLRAGDDDEVGTRLCACQQACRLALPISVSSSVSSCHSQNSPCANNIVALMKLRI